MPRTRAVALCALTVVLALPAAAAAVEGSTRVTGVVSTSSTGDGADRTLVRKRKTVVLRSRAIPMSAPEIPNPMRGQYEWLGSSTVPAGFPTTDVYYRDQVAWKLIEPTPGVYDFSSFDQGIARARELGGRFGFRVMAWCPGCWLDATPDWLPRQPGTDIPAWDDEQFLAAWERLMTELGKRYAAEPALGWVDVGGYGAWGEWHNANQGAEISVDNAVRLMQAVLTAFPKQHVIVNAMVPKYVAAATALSPRIGLRVDCLGEYNMFSLLPTSPILQERWKTAPVLSEWCLTAGTSTTRGADQVRQFHISQVGSPNDVVRQWVTDDPAAAAGFVDAAKSSGYRYAARLGAGAPQAAPSRCLQGPHDVAQRRLRADVRRLAGHLAAAQEGQDRRERRPRARPADRAPRHDDPQDLAGRGQAAPGPLHAVADGHRPGRLPRPDEPRRRGPQRRGRLSDRRGARGQARRSLAFARVRR